MEGLRVVPTEGVEYGEVILPETDNPVEINPEGEDTGGIAIRAWNNNGVVYVGFDDEVDSSTGFPLQDGESLGADLNLEAADLFLLPEVAGDSVRVLITN